MQAQRFEDPPGDGGAVDPQPKSAATDGSTGPESKILQVKLKHEKKLLAIQGVEGVGIGNNHIGDEAIIVYVRDASVKAKIPKTLGGFPVVIEITGIITPSPA